MARDVKLPSATLRVREQGSGDTLVVFACDPPNVVEHYDALLAALPREWRALVFEWPAFGRSRAHPGTGFTLDDHVRVVRELLALERADERTTILAFPCVTAYVALALAARHPALVHGLALSQAPSWEDERRWMDRVDRPRLLRRRIVGQLAMRVLARRVARKWYGIAANDPASMTGPALRAFDEGARFPLADAFQALWRAQPRLAGATQPTVLVWGARDRSHAASEAGSLRALVPHARSVTFDEASHFPDLEAPQRFVAELVALRAQLVSAGPRARS